MSSLHTSLVTTSAVCVSQFYCACVLYVFLFSFFFYSRHSLKKAIYFSSLFLELKSTGTAHHFSFLLNSTDYRILRMDEDHDRMYVGSKDYILSLDLHDINKEPLIVRNSPQKQKWPCRLKFTSKQLVDLSLSDPLACGPPEEDWMCAVRERHQCKYLNNGIDDWTKVVLKLFINLAID